MESRTSPDPATLGDHEAVVGCLRRGGLSWPMVAHANAMPDRYIYGFALVEASFPSQTEGEFVGVVEDIASALDADAYPNLVGFTVEHLFQPGHEFSDTPEVGLDVLLAAVSDFAGDT
jgi:hypothetical protein